MDAITIVADAVVVAAPNIAVANVGADGVADEHEHATDEVVANVASAVAVFIRFACCSLRRCGCCC